MLRYRLNWNSIFRALRHKNYRLFFWGQSISLIGTWMQQVALSWLVYRMTDSAFLLGLVGFVGQIATFLLAPVAGVIADRHHRHRLLVITQSLAMVQALILYILFATHELSVPHILILSLINGMINAFDIPIRQSFTVEMINDPEDLSNAIALNSSMVNAARLVGPSIGGVIIGIFGEGVCFLINALSYIAVLYSLLVMSVPHRTLTASKDSVLHQLKDGFTYAFNFVPIRIILILLSIISLLGGGVQVLMPVFARDIFHGGAQMLGLLIAALGLGALSGAIFLANRKTVLGLGRVIAWSAAIFGVSLIAFSKTPYMGLCLIWLLSAGFGMMVQMASSNTLLQTIVHESKRGRVMSFYTMAFMGMAPFGSLLAGYMAAKVGANTTLLFGGIFCTCAAIWFSRQLPLLRQFIRPVYIEKGILPTPIH